MGLHAAPTTSAHFDDLFVPMERRIGEEGQDRQIASNTRDSGRLGIAAVAVGIAQAALDEAVAYFKGTNQIQRLVISRDLAAK
jgi:alkylation response protein AidB-like acyl-CoA dehydrogenase